MKVEKVVAPGIYRMDNGTYRVVARVGDRKNSPRPKEKRFPRDASLKSMRAWQEDARAEIRRQDLRPAKGTLADDVGEYLKLVQPRFLRHAVALARKRRFEPCAGSAGPSGCADDANLHDREGESSSHGGGSQSVLAPENLSQVARRALEALGKPISDIHQPLSYSLAHRCGHRLSKASQL